MNNTIKLLLIFITTQTLFGCSATRYISSIFHEEVVYIYTSTSYPDQLKDSKSKKLRQRTLILGPYMPNISGGGGAFGGRNHAYVGPMEGKEIVALWRMPTKQKILHYYVRSEPDKGIIRASREGHYSYNVGVAFGPMRVFKEGLTENQFKNSQIAGYTAYGNPLYYRWGDWDKLYYVTGIFTGRELQKIPRKFHEIQGIAITAEQYDKLYERCHGGWKTVRCFMDESFPNLTPEQLAYIQSRKHPDDDYRLSGQHPIPERRINRYN
ncbi:conserved hypothetical protein [Oleispira antarctica RB-8]|uniref:Lipoprotein n=1 Tax=Oleispira antarctica RB-8 TaxID=698738 RepID=R4YP28_OLEAN|nr:conserved hypothetical protein [Oleispira antarctica RB-8]